MSTAITTRTSSSTAASPSPKPPELCIGYCGAIPVGGTRQLSDLFVHPDAHARGVGGQLARSSVGCAGVEVPRQTFSSVALHQRSPCTSAQGCGRCGHCSTSRGPAESLPPNRLTLRDIEAEEAADVEAVWFGWQRLDQYRYWASTP